MSTYETPATVQEQRQVVVPSVPFSPGIDVAVSISTKTRSDTEAAAPDNESMAASRDRMRELFGTIKGFRNLPRIPREELYLRGKP